MDFMQGNFNNNGLGSLENAIPPLDHNVNYYQEYCRLFIANVVLTTQLKELIAEKNELLNRVADLERRQNKAGGGDSASLDPPKKTRIRRKATDISRNYVCPVKTCAKGYGAEGSLVQHIKLKHPEVMEDPDWKMKLLSNKGSEEGSVKNDSQSGLNQ
mmetsp:Transcript_807/g.738  ORF Transcript_807/g.738 Transcript_807/m.738 type:complete len:158 (-) Transcript_807:229-702(-)